MSCQRRSPMRPVAALAAVVLALAALTARSARADESRYPLLVNRFGELCTMCEATVACRAGAPPPATVADLAAADAPPWTLYHFQTKDFWGQVATIWKYLERWIRPVVREERPVVVYESGPPPRRLQTVAALSLDPPRIEVEGRRIDRSTSGWEGPGAVTGRCERLPLRDVLTWLKTRPDLAAGFSP